MCDYSLNAIATRPAVVGETLISTEFRGTQTRGFAGASTSEIAVCIRPGTELVFQDRVVSRGVFLIKRTESRLARFRQINLDKPFQHHDALEFADGSVILLTDLAVGQKARVLQLPVVSSAGTKEEIVHPEIESGRSRETAT